MTSKVLIIIPVYNEQGNIKPIIKGIFHHFKKKKAILFINDNSKDKTELEKILLAKIKGNNENKNDPKVPEIVLLGLIFVNFFPPINLPII